MRPRQGQVADWRDAAAYAPLLEADRAIHAWEWLRRDPDYRLTALTALSGEGGSGTAQARDWGLEVFEEPDLATPLARPMWRRHVHPAVLPVMAAAGGRPEDKFDLETLGDLATVVRSDCGVEHILLSDGFRTIRLDILAGSLAAGPAQLRYLLAGLGSVERPLLTLQRLLLLCRTGRFGRSLHCPEPRARRWLLMLRAHDAWAAGADQRAIAAALLSQSASAPRWRSEAPSLRSQVQRLVRGARRMAAGGFYELLR